MTPEELCFIRAINADPDDDTPRLVYADWLQENACRVRCAACNGSGYKPPTLDDMPKIHERWVADGRIERYIVTEPFDLRPPPKCVICDGAGTVPDGRPDRAEFIRVQCELARLLDGWKPDTWDCLDMYLDPQNREDQEWKHKVWRLRRRERELLADASRDWLGVLADLPRLDGVVDPCVFRRGFVESITCTAEDWLRHADSLYWRPGECPRCEGQGAVAVPPPASAYQLSVICPVCRGTGERPCPPTAQPIRRVVLTTQPYTPAGAWGSLVTEGGTAKSPRWPGVGFELPEEMWVTRQLRRELTEEGQRLLGIPPRVTRGQAVYLPVTGWRAELRDARFEPGRTTTITTFEFVRREAEFTIDLPGPPATRADVEFGPVEGRTADGALVRCPRVLLYGVESQGGVVSPMTTRYLARSIERFEVSFESSPA